MRQRRRRRHRLQTVGGRQERGPGVARQAPRQGFLLGQPSFDFY